MSRAEIGSIVDDISCRKVYLLSEGTINERNPRFHAARKVLPPDLHPPLDPTAPIIEGHAYSLDSAIKPCFERLRKAVPKVNFTVTHKEHGEWFFFLAFGGVLAIFLP